MHTAFVVFPTYFNFVRNTYKKAINQKWYKKWVDAKKWLLNLKFLQAKATGRTHSKRYW